VGGSGGVYPATLVQLPLKMKSTPRPAKPYLQQISVCKPIRKNFLDRRQRGIGLPIKQTLSTQDGMAGQFLVACS
jgi:hypothetical protein